MSNHKQNARSIVEQEQELDDKNDGLNDVTGDGTTRVDPETDDDETKLEDPWERMAR